MYSGARIPLSSVTAPTSLKHLSCGAPNNAVKVFLLPQIDISLTDIKAGLTQQRQLLQGQPQQQQQPQHAQVFLVKTGVTLLDCINQMPEGRVLLVGVDVTQECIDVGRDRARYVSMGAVLSLAGWLDSVVGAVTTRDANYDGLARCLGPGKKVYVLQ